MNSIKSMIIFCITILIGIGITISFITQQERYSLVSQDKAVFVFDKKTNLINYCTPENCHLITPQFTSADAPVMQTSAPGQVFTNPTNQNATPQMVQTQFPQQNIVQGSLQIPADNQGPVPFGMQPQQMVLVAAPSITAPASTNNLLIPTSAKVNAAPTPVKTTQPAAANPSETANTDETANAEEPAAEAADNAEAAEPAEASEVAETSDEESEA